ncbi:hypothetical protein BH09PAT2_BH09PAT2_11390 [soil metagenome]
MRSFIKKELPFLLLGIAIVSYSVYFSFFTILRSEKMYAHYFDLGIMDQTVHNTYKSLQTGDFSRFLELTNPHDGDNQVKRMAIHNDVFLAVLAPFYFIHDGPETLLVVQSLGVAFGAIFIFLITEKVLSFYNKPEPKSKKKYIDYAGWLGLAFGISYLLYPPLQSANVYEFHAATLAPTLLLGMYHFWMRKYYGWSFVFALLAILTKEQVGLVTGFFAIYVILNDFILFFNSFENLRSKKKLRQLQHDVWLKVKRIDAELWFALLLGFFSITWVVISMKFIIPGFRGGEHFGADYYSYIGKNPLQVFPVIFRAETFSYLNELFSPLWYVSILSPAHLAIAIPEFAVVILSNNDNMRNTYFHYQTVLAAFIFLAAIYGVKNQEWLSKRFKTQPVHPIMIMLVILIPAIMASFNSNPLPWAKEFDSFPWKEMPAMVDDMHYWREFLANDDIKVSTTGHLAPHFTGRRYFYDFSWKYTNADYVLIDTHEVQYGYLKDQTIPAYAQLKSDKRYVKIYNTNGLEVYKRVIK